MVYRKPDPLCISQYRGFYNASAAVCNDRSRWLFHMFSAPADLFTGEILYRTCSRGLHDFADRDAVYRQCGDDEPWNYRILYCKDL